MVVKNLKGEASSSPSLVFILLILVSIPLGNMAVNTRASSSDSVKVHFDRLIQIEVGGALVLSDTVEISKGTGTDAISLSHFAIGLPSNFRSNLFYVSAYDDVGGLNVKSNVTLDGFYGVDVEFRDAIDLSLVDSYRFTVRYVLSGLIVFNGARFNVSFPLYPILNKEIAFYNITVVLPHGTSYVNSDSYFDSTTKTTPKYSYQVLNRTDNSLESFTNQISWITFNPPSDSTEFFLIDLQEVVKEISLDPWGNLLVSDTYQLVNKGKRLTKIPFVVPKDAVEVSALSVYGSLGADVSDQDTYKRVLVSFLLPQKSLENEATVKLTIKYRLPFAKYVTQSSFDDYTLTLDFLNFTSLVAKKVVVKVILPEGAEFQAPVDYAKDLSQGEITLTNVTMLHDLNFNLRYQYNILWASFRPVSWVGLSAAIFCAVLFLRGTAKPTVVVIPVPRETLERFLDTYEEKTRISLELASMEKQVRSGKLSKRRQKLRRSSLEARLSKVKKDLTDLRLKIEAVGSQYAELMRRIEVAEAELETLGEDTQRVETRYGRKELSAEAYRRLLDEYSRRRERAENRISEVILRLREETH